MMQSNMITLCLLGLLTQNRLNAMEDELELGSEKLYKQLTITAILKLGNNETSGIIRRFYTTFGARLHAKTADAMTLQNESYIANISLKSPIIRADFYSAERVKVNYVISKSDSSTSTELQNEAITLYISKKHQYITDVDCATLKIIAEWKEQ